MSDYKPQEIEKKWQDYWEKNNLYRAEDFSKKTKQYILIEFPYPSGEGLHVGHVRSYAALDAVSRKKRMEGHNVLYPIGWDAFGLPTENYAIRTGTHPREATEKNIANYKRQLKSLGLSFDWSREINTTDPEYYKWTQWIFLKLFEKGLAYQDEIPINWCTSCKTGLANEEVVGGACERCGASVEKKTLKQWMIRITKYADRLIDDLLRMSRRTLRQWGMKGMGVVPGSGVGAHNHMVILFPELVEEYRKKGYDQTRLQNEIYRHVSVLYEDLTTEEVQAIKTGMELGVVPAERKAVFEEALQPGRKVPLLMMPENIHLFVAGGAPGCAFSFDYYRVPPYSHTAIMTRPITGATLTKAGA